MHWGAAVSALCSQRTALGPGAPIAGQATAGVGQEGGVARERGGSRLALTAAHGRARLAALDAH
jgi:hypothetical protein